MNPFLQVLNEKELHEIFVEESRKFILGLQQNASHPELQRIRQNIIEVVTALQTRDKANQNKMNDPLHA